MPDHWEVTTLGQVAGVVSQRIDPTSLDDEIYVGLEHLVSNERRLSMWGSTSDVSSSTTPFFAGDTLFGRLRPYLRKGCVASVAGVCSPEILVVRQKTGIDPQFLGLLVLRDAVFKECNRLSAGSRMPRTSAKDLMGLAVTLPPLAEQRRIANLIGSIDAYKVSLEAQLKLTKAARSAVLSDMLATSSADWQRTTIGSVAEVVSGGTPRTSTPEFWGDDVVWVTPTEVVASNGGRIFDSIRKISTIGLNASSAKLLPVDAVLLTSRATIGAVALAGVPLATNQGFASLVCGELLLPHFAMYWCQANTQEFIARAGGNTFLEISRQKVARIPMLLPPLVEQRRIVNLVHSIDEHIQSLERTIERTAVMRSGMLSDLLEGRNLLTSEYDEAIGL